MHQLIVLVFLENLEVLRVLLAQQDLLDQDIPAHLVLLVLLVIHHNPEFQVVQEDLEFH